MSSLKGTAIRLMTEEQCLIAPVAATSIINPDMFSFDTQMLPVAAAKGSYGKHNLTGVDDEKDMRLMHYLAEQNHTGPFEHLSFTLFAEMPIFVAREWVRHRTQSYSEISMRYTSAPASRFWTPTEWRDSKDPSGNKQGSGGALSPLVQDRATELHRINCQHAFDTYVELLDLDVCKEQARAAIPVSMITQFFATANLLNWFRFVRLRIASNAMKEIRHYGNETSRLLGEQFPRPWGVLEEQARKGGFL